ncbi:hypothetical protein WICPIJ_001658 [Wickerhamomyces pijperi]|uniref:Uncharacterized protein n=1 Tax=Wickerhamomyces pijperi TaxID=599730 RepID=A0A9P8TQY4_WICPI|nr:hypothetical protein WICPIJ_001658 [Wickerhamomyces pijperi]
MPVLSESTVLPVGVDLLFSKFITLPLLGLLSYFIYTKTPTSSLKSGQQIKEPVVKKTTKEYLVPTKEPEFQYSTLDIQPVGTDFNWSVTPPIKYRPFKKGEYKLVMGINNIPNEEWLLMEDTYSDFTNLKKSFCEDPEISKHINYLPEDDDNSVLAMKEYYEAVVDFMLKRYPMYFSKVAKDGVMMLYNSVNDDFIEFDPEDVQPVSKLVTNLARTIEEDFIILYPDSQDLEGEYLWKGGHVGFASGFYPSNLFNKPLTDIHAKVPEYKTKLRPSMNKFFDKVKTGVFVRRNNWSLQVDPRLLIFAGKKGLEGATITSLDPGSLDYKREVFFRSERQALTRLHRTKAIVFTIRTYMTCLQDIRDEGLGDELIGGITGMQEILGIYKNRPKWGDAAVEFLRGNTDGTDKPWIQKYVDVPEQQG